MTENVADLNIDVQSIPEFDGPVGEVQQFLYTHFAKKRTVRRQNGNVYGNWEDSFAGACSGAFQRSIPEGAIVEISNAGTCPRGEPLMKAVHN